MSDYKNIIYSKTYLPAFESDSGESGKIILTEETNGFAVFDTMDHSVDFFQMSRNQVIEYAVALGKELESKWSKN